MLNVMTRLNLRYGCMTFNFIQIRVPAWSRRCSRPLLAQGGCRFGALCSRRSHQCYDEHDKHAENPNPALPFRPHSGHHRAQTDQSWVFYLMPVRRVFSSQQPQHPQLQPPVENYHSHNGQKGPHAPRVSMLNYCIHRYLR